MIGEGLDQMFRPYREKVEEFNRQAQELEDELNKSYGRHVEWRVRGSWLEEAGSVRRYRVLARVNGSQVAGEICLYHSLQSVAGMTTEQLAEMAATKMAHALTHALLGIEQH